MFAKRLEPHMCRSLRLHTVVYIRTKAKESHVYFRKMPKSDLNCTAGVILFVACFLLGGHA